MNPCVKAYGPGPAGWRCGSCANLAAIHVATKGGPPQTIYYCCLDGQGKRVSWPPCERFVEAPLMTQLSAISHQLG